MKEKLVRSFWHIASLYDWICVMKPGGLLYGAQNADASLVSSDVGCPTMRDQLCPLCTVS